MTRSLRLVCALILALVLVAPSRVVRADPPQWTPVFFIPGYTNDSTVFWRSLNPLPFPSYRVAVAETVVSRSPNGFGMFLLNLADPIGSIPANARQICRDIEAKLQYLGLGPDTEVDLVGYSTGGTIARHIAIAEPRKRFRVRRIVAIGSPLKGISSCIKRNGFLIQQGGDPSHAMLEDLWAYGSYMRLMRTQRLAGPTILRPITGAPYLSPYGLCWGLASNADPELGAWDGVVSAWSGNFPYNLQERGLASSSQTAHAQALAELKFDYLPDGRANWLLESSAIGHATAEFLFAPFLNAPAFAADGPPTKPGFPVADEPLSPIKPDIPPYARYQDAFPFNESVTPGDLAFDTTTALVLSAINTASQHYGGQGRGIRLGDSLFTSVPFVPDLRVDLVFRIKPGPGNYSVPGNPGSSLVERDPAHPFWASYTSSNGEFGTPGGHGANWSPNVWNSARMDTAEQNVYPNEEFRIGGVVQDTWMGTLHEEDPRYYDLGINRNRCFALDQDLTAPVDSVCCSTLECINALNESYPPGIYWYAATQTTEGTKILPDGYFTPGTHVEYFVRAYSPEYGVASTPDTLTVLPQEWATGANEDGERWFHLDVLPDLWKDARFGGLGLACVLLVDAQDGEGSQLAWHGVLDTLGLGKANGASQGWHSNTGAFTDPNNPAGFVAANLGQYGAGFDQFDLTGASSFAGGRLGTRAASIWPELGYQVCRTGPTQEMLDQYYSLIIYNSGKLRGSTFGPQSGEDYGDASMLKFYLEGASYTNQKGLWLAGESLLEAEYEYSESGTPQPDFEDLLIHAGVEYVGGDLKDQIGWQGGPVRLYPLFPAFYEGQGYQFLDGETYSHDVIAPRTPDAIAIAEAREGQSGYPGTVSVSSGPDSYYKVLTDAFDLRGLRGVGPEGGTGLPTLGRIRWVEHALNYLDVCGAVSPVVSVKPVPGIHTGPAKILVTPNPHSNASVQFSFLVADGTYRARIFDVAGGLVQSLDLVSAGGIGRAEWDGRDRSGAEVGSGVLLIQIRDAATGSVVASSRFVKLR